MVFSSLFEMHNFKNSLIFYPQNLWIRLWINKKNLINPKCGLREEKLYIFYTINLFIILFNYLWGCIRVMFVK